jgi:polyisoprenoid-binding protein YceI
MTSKFLRFVGVAALIAMAAASLASLLIVRERIHVTIEGEPDAGRRAPDELATLSDDVAELRGDVQALGEALTAGMQALCAEIDRAGRAASENAAAIAEPLVAVPDPAATSEPEPAGAQAPESRSFLSFRLPSQSFSFDRRQRLAIVPSLSRVGFDGQSTLHDFSGVTSRVEGELEVTLARPEERPIGTLRVDAASLDTGLAARDEEMREHLDTAQFPELRFDWSGFEARAVDVAARRLSGVAQGRMTIRGTTRAVSMPVEIAVDESLRVSIEGQAKLRLSDFGIPIPGKLGVISMEDEITVWIALRARSLGSVKDGTDG